MPPTRFGRTFLALFALGMLGVLALIPMILDTVGTLPPEMLDLPPAAVVLVSLAQSMILLAIAVAAGTILAHRLGLRSLVADRVRVGTPIWPELRPHIGLAVGLGALFFAVVVILDLILAPFADVEMVNGAPGFIDLVSALVMGILYGGITEELLLRWGVMSFIAWAGWRLLQRDRREPGPGMMWAAIALSALLFGIGHLPALAQIAPLTMPLIVRTVGLNALGGLVFGWLFWKYSLEVAMVSHATFHVALFIMNSVAMLLGAGGA